MQKQIKRNGCVIGTLTLSLVDIAKKLGLPIDKPGDRCKSPFHEGHTSTSFYCGEDFWYSFSDNMGGDQIDLWALLRCEGDRGRAIGELFRMNGIKIEDDLEWKSETQKRCTQIAYWHDQLRQEDRDYLHKRGITDKTINRLRLGFANGGIVVPYYENGYVYDYTVRKYQGEPRYKRMGGADENSPWGQETLSRGDVVWLVEGTFDAITLDQEGKAVLQTTNPPLEQIQYFKNVVLAYDIDDTGKEFTFKVAQKLFANRINFMVAEITGAKDINEFYSSGGKIEHIPLRDGLKALCESFTEIDQLQRFACAVARHCNRTRLATLYAAATQFSERELGMVEKAANSAPTESEIAGEILKTRQLIYIDQIGYYNWNGTIWKRESDMRIGQISNETYGIFSTANRCTNVTNLLKKQTLTEAIFDRKPVLTFLNGTLELETGVFRRADPNDYCSLQMHYAYDPEAKCPEWDKFISEITDEDCSRTEILQFIAGYTLFSDCRHQKIFALIGDGGNGKSVYLDILQRLFGSENCSNIDPAGMEEAFRAIYLKDSLLNVGSEIDSDFTKAEKILKVVAAGEEVTACFKGQNFVKFNPRCKLIFACNEMPKANVVKGLDRRMVFINFPCKFVESPNPANPKEKKRDLDIIPKLVTELPGIFNWAYRGYQKLHSAGYFTETLEQKEFMEQFKETSNPIIVFVNDYPWDEGKMTKDEIYVRYTSWCGSTGHKALSRETFFPKWKEAMGKKFKEEKRVRMNKTLTSMCFFANPQLELLVSYVAK